MKSFLRTAGRGAPPAAASSAPHEWRYRAEGGVHAVFAYAGAARALRGAVLRVRKRRASDGEVAIATKAFAVAGPAAFARHGAHPHDACLLLVEPKKRSATLLHSDGGGGAW